SSLLEISPLLLARLLVLSPRRVDGLDSRYLGHGYVPPALVIGHPLVAIDFDADDGRPRRLTGALQRPAQLVDAADPHGLGAQARRVRHQVARQHCARRLVAVEPERSVFSKPVLRAETVHPQRSGEAADG